LLALTLLSAIAAGVSAAPAAATDPALRPLNLRVQGGETTWHDSNVFRLDWESPRSGDRELEITAIHFRIRDSDGEIVGPETRVAGGEPPLGRVRVPAEPGRYEIELWLEAPDGETGPAATADLRFDDVRPPPARPLPAAGWTAGTTTVRLRLEHPAGTLPISGIRGYAISVGAGGGIAPCAMPDRCTPAETDLSSGIGGDTASLGLLPQGTHTVRTVAVSGSGVASVESSGTIRVDATAPDVRLEAPAGWFGGPVLVTARAADSLSGMAPAGPGGPYTAIAVDGGVDRTDPGAAVTASVAGEGTHEVVAYARDGAGNVSRSSARIASVRIDETPPAIAFARSQDPAEPERIEATAVDALSGVDPARGSIALRPAGSRARFQALPTSFERGRLVAHWDSDTFAPGSYEFRASARDLAGNGSGTDRRGNGTRMVLANPLKLMTLLNADLDPGRESRSVAYGRRVVYQGHLRSISGAPLAGLPVEVIETFAAGAAPAERTTVVRSGADGGFRTRLAPGPSRRVAVRFAGSKTLTRSEDAGGRLAVTARLRMRASATTARIGGAAVTFSGQVGTLGTRVPTGGRPVELQFRLPGKKWSEFRTVRTDARGRFRYAYSFSDDDSRGIRFQFRAFIAAQDGWPYEPTGSKPVFVTGR
jgi:hypothetical protein